MFQGHECLHGSYTLLRHQCKAQVVKMKVHLLRHTYYDSSEAWLSFSWFLCVPGSSMPDSELGVWGVEPACFWHFAVEWSSDPTHCWCSEVSSALRFFRTWYKWFLDLRWAERKEDLVIVGHSLWIAFEHIIKKQKFGIYKAGEMTDKTESYLTLIHGVHKRAHLSTPGHRWSLYHTVHTYGGCAYSVLPSPPFWLAQQMAALPAQHTKKSIGI